MSIEISRAHTKTRVKIEQAFGQLKRRWNCLHQELRVSPDKACACFTACAVLHNISKEMNMPDFPHNDDFPQENAQDNLQQIANRRDTTVRANITQDNFA